MRAFLALPDPDATVDALGAIQSHIPVGRPVPEENLHLTLAFLGDVGEAVLADLDEILSSTPLPSATGRLRRARHLRRDGTRPRLRRGAPRPPLAALQSKVARVARMAGADLPRRRFRPHVTLSASNRQPVGPARDRLAAALGLPVDIPAFVATELLSSMARLDPGRRAARGARPLSPVPDFRLSPPRDQVDSRCRAEGRARSPSDGARCSDRKCPVVRSPDRSSSVEADGAPVRQGGKGSRRSAQSPAPARDTARPVRGET
jgi:2'-5' RNA ligase